MAEARPAAVLDWNGPLAPPRRNGELVFDTLWESRVFGMTMVLYEAQAFTWDEFRDRLIGAIAAWERAHHPDDSSYRYWDCWLAAFEQLVADKNLCPASALAERVAAFEHRPHGHDHPPAPARRHK
jgi:nitrile hydratase accessory protein